MSSEKMIFFSKVVGPALELSAKRVFILDKYQLKIWVEKLASAVQHIGNRTP